MDQLVKSAPTDQIELDLFKDEWTSVIPIPNTVTGQKALKGTPSSIRLARRCFGPLNGFNVLELGPHECEMTVALSREKIENLVSIEARAKSHMKCLVIKNIMGLKNVRFRLGNFVEYLKVRGKHFDLCLACDVLYHTTDPLELIDLICSNCDRVVVASCHSILRGCSRI